MAWLEKQSGSSVPGKVNYRQLLKTVNMFEMSKPDDYIDRKRIDRTNRYNDEVKLPLKSPKEMRMDFLKGDNQAFKHDEIDTEVPEHFYAKNFIEYPIYEYVGGEEPDPSNINYQVSNKDEKNVFGSKHVRLPNDPKGNPGLDIKNREDYVKLKY